MKLDLWENPIFLYSLQRHTQYRAGSIARYSSSLNLYSSEPIPQPEPFVKGFRGIKPLRMSHIQPEYKDFKYSQLVEMLGMSDSQREQATPNMTVKQLRELKSQTAVKQQSAPQENQTTGQTSGQNELKSVVINNCWKDLDPEIIKTIVQASNIRWNPKSCYNIKIELHKG